LPSLFYSEFIKQAKCIAVHRSGDELERHVHDHWFSATSDIDLAVSGLAPDDYWLSGL
jgi:hypothetical protein